MVSMRAADEDGILDGTFKDHGQTERNDCRMIMNDERQMESVVTRAIFGSGSNGFEVAPMEWHEG